MLCDGTHPLFHVSPVDTLSDYGDLILPNTNLSEVRKKLEESVTELLGRNKHMIWLGGDHSVTLSLLRAYRQHYG
jgi:agmatinase